MGINISQLANAIKKFKNYIDNDAVNLSDVDFVSESGFGGLRIYEGKYQYYNECLSSWVDVQVTDDNTYISKCIPNPVTSFSVELDSNTHKVKIKLSEPKDTIVNNTTTFTVQGIKIVIKRGSEPESVDDGDLLLDLPRSKFGSYNDEWFINDDYLVMNTDTYYCKAFSYNELGICNNSGSVSSFSYTAPEVYGFTLDQSERDPDSMITYFGNNELYTLATTNSTTMVFDYGDWKDAWFVKNCRPCMLKYDGTVDYYLNPDDYTKKEDGTDSDIADSSYEGNAMIEFPKVYIKREIIDEDKMNVYVSNAKIDDTYHCYAHIDANGDEIDYTYMSIYDGAIIGEKLKSVSGVATTERKTIQNYIDSAKKNNTGTDDIWNIGTYADYQLLITLLLLLGKTTNIAYTFGPGRNNIFQDLRAKYKHGAQTNKMGMFSPGKLSSTTEEYDNKVFGMENPYGLYAKFIVGLIRDSNGIQKVKMYKTDGESDDYNLTGEGYHEIGYVQDIVSSNAYMDSNNYKKFVGKMWLSEYGLVPKTTDGTLTTTYRAEHWSYPGAGIPSVGNMCITNKYTTPLSLRYTDSSFIGNNSAGYAYMAVTARLSCKPLANPTTDESSDDSSEETTA